MRAVATPPPRPTGHPSRIATALAVHPLKRRQLPRLPCACAVPAPHPYGQTRACAHAAPCGCRSSIEGVAVSFSALKDHTARFMPLLDGKKKAKVDEGASVATPICAPWPV